MLAKGIRVGGHQGVIAGFGLAPQALRLVRVAGLAFQAG